MLRPMTARRLAPLAPLTLALACSPIESASTGSSDTAATMSSTGASPTEASTGETMWCQGWESAVGEPTLELRNSGILLTDGGTLALECGPQGLLMFGLYPNFTGISPVKNTIYFDVVLNVVGHDTNPDGHFYNTEYSYYVGCDELEGGVLGVIPLFPPDGAEVALLDGLPAELHITMRSGIDTVTLDLALKLEVDPGENFELCGKG